MPGGDSHRRQEQFPSASSSFSPDPGIYGGPIQGGCRSLSGAGRQRLPPQPRRCPLSLSLQNQDGLDCWTKQARLIAQGLISGGGVWGGGCGPPPTS